MKTTNDATVQTHTVQSDYEMNQIGGFMANGVWVHCGDAMFLDSPWLGYRQPVRVIGASSNGRATWATIEYVGRSAGMGRDVIFSTDALHCAADNCP